MNIRTRFAPSPTGYLHVGNIRTALFAYLAAKNAGGTFVLRIEDTDQKRKVADSVEHLQKSLRLIGITPDEGVGAGGEYGPYTQSERLDIYKEWAQKLVDAGYAYADPYSSDDIQAFRQQAQDRKQAFLYRRHRPDNPPAWDGTQPLRLKVTPQKRTWHDQVMGDMVANEDNMDDIILMKSDGYPTYNFAHIIDDHLMQITHVIRGMEFISSMPNYLNIYEALDIPLPTFAHMPHILGEQGSKKLSKRDGAMDVLDYVDAGYLGQTLMSFIATMGWNDGTEKEIFTHEELIEAFSLDRIQKSGARFDEKRMLWMNGHFIRELPLEELYEQCKDFWPAVAQSADKTYKMQVLALLQDRLKTLQDLRTGSDYFFAEPTVNMELITKNKQLKKLSEQEHTELLDATHDALAHVQSWDAASIQATLNELLEQTGQKPGVLFSLIRVYATWAAFSPQLPDTLALLGRETTLARLAIKH